MEKRNTILLTVIAVATLLVAVVGATFAYFAQSGDYNATANLTANTAAASSSFVATGSAIQLEVTAAQMVKALEGNVANTSTVENAITVSFTSGSTEQLSCTYDIYYKWTDSSDTYTMSNGAANSKEFTYEITKNGSAFAGGETNFATKDAADHVVDTSAKQTITNKSATEATVDRYNVTVRFYNLAQDQSIDSNNQSGKHWALQFGVKNVLC